MNLRLLPFLSIAFLTGTSLWAADDPSIHLDSQLNLKADASSGVSFDFSSGATIQNDDFRLRAALSAHNDRSYGSDVIDLRATNDLGAYFLVDEGSLTVHLGGLTLEGGRYFHGDVVDSPYSLFLNAAALPANGATLRYQAGGFRYSSEWISLTYRSNFGSTSHTPKAWSDLGLTGFPDRGTSIHTFSYTTGPWNFGFQDQAIYSQRAFDAEYLLSPVPQYFTQYLRNMGGRPWTTSGTDKYMMGLFGTWADGGNDGLVQLQMADFNMHFLGSSTFPNNPGKFAWSVGGHWGTDWGRFGVFHAGATKYMYEPLGASRGEETVRDFGDTYIPDTEYSRDGGFVPVDRTLNMVGYQHGENNLALRFTWDDQVGPFALDASLEGVLKGNQSPANPWQDATSVPDTGTQIFTDSDLERTLLLRLGGHWSAEGWTLGASLTVGEVFHALQLQASSQYVAGTNSTLDEIKVWKVGTDNVPVLTLVTSAAYRY